MGKLVVAIVREAGPLTSMKYGILCTLFTDHEAIDPNGCSRGPVVTLSSVSVLASWEHPLHRASFVKLDALHGDRSAAPSPYI